MHMYQEWQLQEAKNKLSLLVKKSSAGEPQCITVRGRKTAVLLSMEDYEKLCVPDRPLSSDLLAPILEASEESLFTRNRDTGRTLDL